MHDLCTTMQARFAVVIRLGRVCLQSNHIATSAKALIILIASRIALLMFGPALTVKMRWLQAASQTVAAFMTSSRQSAK